MRRRNHGNRDIGIGLGLAKIIILPLLLLGVTIPEFRHNAGALAMILFGLIALVGVVALGVYLIRRTERPPLFTNTSPTTKLDALGSSSSAMSLPTPALTISDLIAQLRSVDWFKFEKVVALAYRKLGYIVARRGGANPDGGIDLTIIKDGQTSAVQCKHWKSWKVTVKEVREFLGALTDAEIKKGIFITLCGYTDDARTLAAKHGIEIVDQAGLAQMLKMSDGSFDPDVLALLKDQRKHCPKCEREMILRTASRGAGLKFWRCSAHPRCRFTMPVS
jgi:hypothetical protein